MRLYEGIATAGMFLAFIVAFIGLFSYQMWMVLVSGFVMLALLYIDDRRRLAKFRRTMNEDRP